MRPEVWAPEPGTVRAQLQTGGETRTVELSRDADRDGWWVLDEDLAPGTRYGYLLDDDETPIPDPRSQSLPDGVHGLTEVYDSAAYEWADGDWAGHELAQSIVYELHIGTFTQGATLDSAIERLQHLVDLGITHVELLPVNAVNGVWNWGYDGVDWYAVHAPYGGPDALKRFVDACHAHGLAVLLDVVYNHLGPSGNYLPKFGPYLKTGKNTWGDLINLDAEGSENVRRFIIDNALTWLRDFHLDGLRLDAVHALQDESPVHVLTQLATEVAELSAQVGRPLPLIAESDLNDPAMVTAVDRGGIGMDGQWDDDVHHVLHAMLSGERYGYYVDFGSLASLAKVFTGAFFHDGTYSTFRKRNHGKPVDRATTPGWKFVVCLQDHDQIGNRAVGDRLPEIVSHPLLKVGAMLLLTSPFTPMLFMGEEWAAGTRWPFFTSHPQADLGKAVSEGRIAEFADHGWDTDSMIDPQDPAAYREAILDWSEPEQPEHAELLDLYRKLIQLRKDNPGLADPHLDQVAVDFDEDAQWASIARPGFRVVVNLADHAQQVSLPSPSTLVLATGDAPTISGSTIELPPTSAAIVALG